MQCDLAFRKIVWEVNEYLKWTILQVITDSTSSDRLSVTKTHCCSQTHTLSPKGNIHLKEEKVSPWESVSQLCLLSWWSRVPQRSITSVHHNRNQWVHNSETNVHEAPKWEWNTMHYCVVVIHYHCANSKVKHQKKSYKLKETRKCFVWENRQSGMGSKHPCLLKKNLIVGTLPSIIFWSPGQAVETLIVRSLRHENYGDAKFILQSCPSVKDLSTNIQSVRRAWRHTNSTIHSYYPPEALQ